MNKLAVPVRAVIALLALALLTSSASAQVVRMKVYFSGTESGSTVHERKEDGSFTSTTDVTIGDLKLYEKLEGRFEDGVPVALRVEVQSPGQPLAIIELVDGKVKLTRGEETREEELKDEIGTLHFANLDPQFSAGCFKEVVWEKKEAQKVSPFMLDAGRKIELTITPQKERPTKAGVARIYKVGIGPLEAEYALSEDGTIVGMDVPAQKLRWVVEGWDDLYVDPLAAYPELSQPEHKVATDRGVKMQTRDGVTLVADVFRPEAEGKFPVILARTPYGRATAGVDGPLYVRWFDTWLKGNDVGLDEIPKVRVCP